MATRTITSANSTFIITVPGVFVAPQQLQGYSADDMFSVERQTPTEMQQGVDGFAASGFMFQLTKQGIILLPNSPSIDVFDQWWQFMLVARDSFLAQAVITLPSLAKKFVMVDGSLTGYAPMPGAGRTLKPRDFEVTWNQIIPQPI